jgi:tRNA U38,U39,U40 pseudouridine synthase TruA
MSLICCPFSVCESRKYTYFFPTYLLIPPKPGSGLHKIWAEHSSKFTDTTSAPIPDQAQIFWEGKELNTKEEDLAIKRSWRVNQDQVQTIRKLAARYEGTHNFHNFTVGRDFTDRSNNRYMKKIEVSLANSKTIQFNLCIVAEGVRPSGLRRNGVDQCPLPWSEFHVAPGVYTNLFFLRKSTDFNLVDCELHLTLTYS